MKVIDLTHTIESNMPVFPGTEKPKLEIANTIEKDGFKETLLTMFSHTGTHMDSPAHIFEDGATLDSYDVEYLTGRGVVIDCSAKKKGQTITMEDVMPYSQKIADSDYVLFRTGWDKYWGDEKYYDLFPYIDINVVRYLVESHVRGIGLDVISLDPMADVNLSNHRLALGNNVLIIENLTNLDKIKNEDFLLCLMPLKYKNADGAPIRAIAMLSGKGRNE